MTYAPLEDAEIDLEAALQRLGDLTGEPYHHEDRDDAVDRMASDLRHDEWRSRQTLTVDRVRDIIGQPLPGVIAGRYIIARNGDTFEVWEATAPDVLERRARGVESAAVARALAVTLNGPNPAADPSVGGTPNN